MFSQIQSTSNTSLIQIMYVLKQLSKLETVNFTPSSWVYSSCISVLEDLRIPVTCNGFVCVEGCLAFRFSMDFLLISGPNTNILPYAGEMYSMASHPRLQ